jgi:nicotinate-nucleotide adenylyltransferase
MAKIGLLGGAFDPPHNGHLAVARAVLHARKLDRVDFLVAGTPPHAEGKRAAAPAQDRAAMAALAVEGIAGLGVESCETARPGRSYSVDTLRALKAAHPGNHYEFIIGADMLASLHTWREVHALLRLAAFIHVARPGWPSPSARKLEQHFDASTAAALAAGRVEAPQLAVSSTAIRAAVAAGESIAAMVPPAVEAYIRARCLYRA